MGTKTCPTPPHNKAKDRLSKYHPLAESFWAQYFA